MRGRALVIATSHYADADLAPLPSAERDAQGLAPLLEDPRIGDLAVTQCRNFTSQALREQIEALFACAAAHELVLLYISGHGFKDAPGRLYFAATDTRQDRPLATAIPSSFIDDAASNGRSRRVVMIFDSCFSGAVAKGWDIKAGGVQTVNLGDYFEKSTGRVVITATDTTHYALAREGEPSLFTKHLIQGLRSGEADLDGDGRVSSAELVEHVAKKMRAETQDQEPMRWVFDLKGDLVIAANPAIGVLPREIRDLIENPAVLARAHAVERLAPLLSGDSRVLAGSARAALERLEQDPERAVARAAAAALLRSADLQGRPPLVFEVASDEPAPAPARGRSAAELPGVDLLPKHLRVLLDHPDPEVRLPMVTELARLLSDRTPAVSGAARRALEWLKNDADARVSHGAAFALKESGRKPGHLFRDAPDCPEMVVIPPGRFLMGSPHNETGHSGQEAPVHEVSIDYPLAVARDLTTRGEWQRYLATTHRKGSGNAWGFNRKTGTYERAEDYGWSNPGFPQEDSHPVVCITWHEAVEYAAWLAAKTGQPYRLLSEAEYEYVSRAGTHNAYWWGSSCEEQWRYANGADAALKVRHNSFGRCIAGNDGFAYTSPVGHFPANPFGLRDTSGNVWCWTQDRWHENYAGAPTDGSAWESGSDHHRVVRGGSWIDAPERLRSACRRRGRASGYYAVGLRVARAG